MIPWEAGGGGEIRVRLQHTQFPEEENSAKSSNIAVYKKDFQRGILGEI
jgi:hypothetical protein